ncbi:MAG: PASTA domain-containing protein [Armatimonadetes bacterium]|nr:PASTA domain-containing protein [Armatimonadota bacterium]
MSANHGAVIAGRYEVAERIAEGGMSTVCRARRLDDGAVVALKILRGEYAADHEFIERFAREARAAEALAHPNIVRVLESGQDGDTYFIAMEYVDGPDLKAYLRRVGRLEPADAERIALLVCEALDYAHRQGIIHRDVKPQNILLAPDGSVKVADFGIARALATSTITQPGTVIGTVHYLSPEQARGAAVGRGSDIYALGVVLFEMLTGRLPFAGDSPIAIALKHLHEPPPAPRAIEPSIPLRLEGIILKAMAKSSQDRYGSAREMAGDLEGKTELWRETAATDEGTTRRFALPGEVAPTRPGGAALRIAAAVLVIVSLGAWAGWQAVNGYLNVPEVEMPDLVGRTLPQAELISQQAGLTIAVTERAYSPTVSQDIVLSQDQPPGKRVKRGRRIGVVLSLGAQLVTVPDLVRRTLQEAQLALEGAGLQAGTLQEAHDEIAKAGTVIRQDPPAGSRVPLDTPVLLVISRGPPQVEMPSLVGRALADARLLLEERGLVITHLRTLATTAAEPGTVLEQSPPAATPLRPGAVQIILTVSARPGEESAPPRAPVITAEPQIVEPQRPPTQAPRALPTPVPTPGQRVPPAPTPAPGPRVLPSPQPSPAVSPGLVRRTRVQVIVPEGGLQEVRIVVIDETGVRTAYQAPHSPGDRVDQTVRSQGYTIIQVYVDGRLVQEIRP